jgi:effector-binding domain-containing protein
MVAVAPTMGRLFADVAQWAIGHGVSIAGPAIARYDDMNEGRCAFDAGFFIDRAPKVDDADIQTIDVGNCTAVRTTHFGSYESLASTYWALETWMKANGFEQAGPMWEEYFSPPGTPPEQIRTDIYWPVRKVTRAVA